MNVKKQNMPRDITLMFTDFDWSCGINGSIPEKNVASIVRFLEHDPQRHTVIASARPHYSLREIIDKTSLRNYSNQISISAFSGALSFYGEEVIKDNSLDRDLVKSIMSEARKTCMATFFFAYKKIYSPSDKTIIDWYNKNLVYSITSDPMPASEKVYLLELWRSESAGEEAFMSIGSGSDDKIKKHLFNSKLKEFKGLNKFMHIMPAGIGKEHALSAYINRMNINPDKVMVIGDEVNDIKALSTPGVLAVTFADAITEARSIPGIYVAPPAKECGFAEALDSLVIS